MLKYKILLACVLVAFASYTLFAMSISNQSLLSFGYQMVTSPDTAQVLIDLYIMALLAITWILLDCKKLGKPIWYWALFTLLTLVFVSVGPLLYLILRSNNENDNET